MPTGALCYFSFSAIMLLFETLRLYANDSDMTLMPAIICLINLTAMSYDVIFSFSKRGLVDLLYQIIKVIHLINLDNLGIN